MVSRNGRSDSSSRASPSCSKSPSSSSPAACHDTCGQSTPPSHVSLSPSLFSVFSCTLGSWSPARPRMSVHSKLRHRQLSGIPKTAAHSGSCWQVCLRPRSSRLPAPPGRTSSRGSFRHSITSTKQCDVHFPGRPYRPTFRLALSIRGETSDTRQPPCFVGFVE